MKSKHVLFSLAVLTLLSASLIFTSCAGTAYRTDNRQDHRDDRQGGREDHRDDRQEGRQDRRW
jgi:hypothetical protein